jgi:hypothetical protein
MFTYLYNAGNSTFPVVQSFERMGGVAGWESFVSQGEQSCAAGSPVLRSLVQIINKGLFLLILMSNIMIPQGLSLVEAAWLLVCLQSPGWREGNMVSHSLTFPVSYMSLLLPHHWLSQVTGPAQLQRGQRSAHLPWAQRDKEVSVFRDSCNFGVVLCYRPESTFDLLQMWMLHLHLATFISHRSPELCCREHPIPLETSRISAGHPCHVATC